MEEHDGGDKRKAPLDAYDNVEPSPLPPIAPDGGFAPDAGISSAPSVPAATPDSFVCLRGPCRHYFELHTFMASGNPADTWGDDGLREAVDVDADGNVTYSDANLRMPRQINRSCLAHPGTETELTDDAVYFCNRWDPLSPREVRKLARRRERHYRRFPHHQPIDEIDEIADLELDDDDES